MRRARDSGAKFDSFPFLNVMIGMIVILLLFMLMILTTRAMTSEVDQHDAAVVASAIEQARAANADQHAGTDGEGDLSDEDHNQLRTEIDRLTTRIREQRAKLDDLLGAKTEIESLILAKQDEINLASLAGDGEIGGYVVGEPAPTVMIPDSSVTVSKKPRFVEVDAENFVFHAESEPQSFAVGDLRSGTGLDAAIQRADRNRSSEYLLLLIHPNGAEAYEEFRKYLLKNYNETSRKAGPFPGTYFVITKSRIQLGVDPFSSEWLLIAKQKQ